jgi:hypothetical protein
MGPRDETIDGVNGTSDLDEVGHMIGNNNTKPRREELDRRR